MPSGSRRNANEDALPSPPIGAAVTISGNDVMLYLIIKALLSGAIIAAVSEIAKRSPTFGALVVSLPLTSLLAFIWFYRDTSDTENIASMSQSTFWFVLPSLPMFLVLPALLRGGFAFWSALGLACLLTIVLYFAMVWALGSFGVSL
jgi:hypothetical protein